MVAPITVIIPSRDRYRDLRRCLIALAECDGGLLHEVLVVDDGSRPRITDAVAVGDLPVRVLRNDRPMGATPARAHAADHARSPILAFLDDDALPRADWLTEIAAQLTPDRGAVTGRVLPFDAGLLSEARQSRYLERYRDLEPGQRVTFFAGGNSAVWRERFLAARGTAVNVPGSDNDLVSGLSRLGLGVHFAPSMVIVHRNGKGLLRALRDAYGSGHHARPLPVRDALRDMARPVPGSSPQVRLTNRMLNLVHLAGRSVPRSTRQHP
ncbi:glycosyltransferase family 2 protein [Actinomadura opuntiae]|uniref:glycosyltransferase family 2 protein n=1 Tax=Actinomadura sp. OS1-43 TaxID=604315 RepID=UPI00255A805F|nr:glycosyltransferase [Actinomadura sp. OS1-43]MDL4816958.1 glycosyltransferase [Actinomadura sp. OS1-43]